MTTLHEALAARGLTSRKENDAQRRTIYGPMGERIGSFDAHEAWAWLAEQTELSEEEEAARFPLAERAAAGAPLALSTAWKDEALWRAALWAYGLEPAARVVDGGERLSGPLVFYRWEGTRKALTSYLDELRKGAA